MIPAAGRPLNMAATPDRGVATPLPPPMWITL